MRLTDEEYHAMVLRIENQQKKIEFLEDDLREKIKIIQNNVIEIDTLKSDNNKYLRDVGFYHGKLSSLPKWFVKIFPSFKLENENVC